MRNIRSLFMMMMIGAAMPLAGCPDRDGPMENAGEKIDEAAEDVSDAVDETVDDIQE